MCGGRVTSWLLKVVKNQFLIWTSYFFCFFFSFSFYDWLRFKHYPVVLASSVVSGALGLYPTAPSAPYIPTSPTNLSLKILGLAMDPEQISKGLEILNLRN